MKKIRLIIASSENGEQECVIFTEDFETPAEDFFLNLAVSFDETMEILLPDIFPTEYILTRE